MINFKKGVHIMRLAAIEAGGTKFICAIGDDLGNIFERIVIPTTTPEETMEKAIDFFNNYKFDALGIGCFGPIDLDLNSSKYGYITSTPKVAWRNYNIVGKLKKHFSLPIIFDTDVNAAALGELRWGNAKGLDSCLYITVGTGIGAGAVTEGNMVHGLMHPEMGHIMIKKYPGDTYEGKCPYHKDCLEGMACGPAIEERWGIKAYNLEESHEAWSLEAFYLAQALVNYILVLSPKKIVMGGGVMKQRHLFPLIRENVVKILNGYVDKEEIINDIENYITYPGLGDDAGICGALALGSYALK